MEKNKNLARESLLRVLYGEPWEEIVDDITSRLGEEKNLNCLELPGFARIEIKRDGKLIEVFHRTDFFYNPPTKEVFAVREVLNMTGLELISREDFISNPKVTLKTGESTLLIQVEQGFWSTWIIIWEGIPYGAIKISGNFWDRSTDLVIDIPTSVEKAVRREIEKEI